MIKKLVHRVILAWCLYGLYLIMSAAHPYLLWLMIKYGPVSSPVDSFDHFMIWLLTLIGIGAMALVYCGLSEFCSWIFKEKEDEDTWGDDVDDKIQKLNSGYWQLKAKIKRQKATLKAHKASSNKTDGGDAVDEASN